MKRIFIFLLTLIVPSLLIGQIKGPIKISEDQRFLAQADDSPFFWMADTAWELFHKTIEKRPNITSILEKLKGLM